MDGKNEDSGADYSTTVAAVITTFFAGTSCEGISSFSPVAGWSIVSFVVPVSTALI
jgi:hypothetical protein